MLDEQEQIATVKEIWRVLDKRGQAIIEGMQYREATVEEIQAKERSGFENRIENSVVEGHFNPHYLHDEQSFARICQAVGIQKYALSIADWGGRPRQIFTFVK